MCTKCRCEKEKKRTDGHVQRDRQRHTLMQTGIDRQTCKQSRHTERHTDRKTIKQTKPYAHRDILTQRRTHNDKETERQTHTAKQTNKQT